jgi:hypothetical protein
MFNKTNSTNSEGSSYVQENVVYSTTNLEIFKTIAGNRVPNLQHVRRLVGSIKQYGMKCNPILVNERGEVIDGQHRLLAAKECKSKIYFIRLKGYGLPEVHTLNLNQKNWNKKDFMEGYADMGIEPYVKLKKFVQKNEDFSFSDCVALCSQTSSALGSASVAQKFRNGRDKMNNITQVFEEGTWIGRDFELGQEWANKIRMIKPYYIGYNRSTFVGTMIILFTNKKFDFNEFMHKVRLQPTALVDCSSREQYKTLIEDIYNYRSRNKVNLRY